MKITREALKVGRKTVEVCAIDREDSAGVAVVRAVAHKDSAEGSEGNAEWRVVNAEGSGGKLNRARGSAEEYEVSAEACEGTAEAAEGSAECRLGEGFGIFGGEYHAKDSRGSGGKSIYANSNNYYLP